MNRDKIHLLGYVYHLLQLNKKYGNDSFLKVYEQLLNELPSIQSILDRAVYFSTLGNIQTEKSEYLLSIFNEIGGGINAPKLKFSTQVISLGKEVFPKSQPEHVDLKSHWKQFVHELNQLIDWQKDIKVHIHNLSYLIKKYFWLTPSSNSLYTSLYDEIRFTAVFAEAIWLDEIESRDYVYRIVCGDLSGIQNFLYNISSRYAAKSLRGRSFYLQHLLEKTYSELLNRLSLHPSNLIYSSGGKFFLLVPNTSESVDIISNYREEVQEALWKKYENQIYLCLDSLAFNVKENQVIIEGETEEIHIGLLWKKIADKTSNHKTQKLLGKIKKEDVFDQLFLPNGEGGLRELCSVTGIEGKLKTISTGVVEKIKVSDAVFQQIEIGKKLVHHRYVVLDHSSLEGEVIIDDSLDQIEIGDKIVFKTLHPSEKADFEIATNVKSGFKYFGGSEVAMNGNESKDFEEMAGDGEFKRLGYLRMDVDNLGKIFIQGIPDRLRNFTSYSTLSGLLDWFFSGYINTIRSKSNFKDDVNIIYSGGDDLFVVGRWDKIVEFADEIQREFKSFTGRYDISISGGIALVTGKFPISKAALMAGDAEDQSKEHIYRNAQKNAITFLDISVNWDWEFPKVVEIKK